MSEIVIIASLLAPVLLVIFILNKSRNKQRKKTQDRLAGYLHEIANENGMKHGFQKQLIHQLVTIDESSRKILVVDHRENDLWHELHSLDFIKTLKVMNLKQTIPHERNKTTEVITTQIAVEIAFEKPEKEIFLVFYDHTEHNIFQMAELEKEAWQFHERITKAGIRQLINT